MGCDGLDVRAIREHFAFPQLGRVVTNNAASTQPPRELTALWQSLAPGYENVHRGQSSASQTMTGLFEESYDTIATFLGAPSRASIALYRNTTGANNASALPFLYGGNMIAEGRVLPDLVEWNALPWKYAAGTPNILGAIISAQALRLLLDLALTPKRPRYFGTAERFERPVVAAAMGRVAAWNQQLTAPALDRLSAVPGITVYGPLDAGRRTALVASTLTATTRWASRRHSTTPESSRAPAVTARRWPTTRWA